MSRTPSVWGILNVTPDSFSDGGRYRDPDHATRRGWDLAAAGADVLDIGGESTRPGAAPVPLEEERSRILPVVQALAGRAGAPRLSIDTRNAAVARGALEAGAAIVNDVSAGLHDPALLEVVAEHGAEIVLMHMRGDPQTMQDGPRYDDVVEEVLAWLLERAAVAEATGIARSRIWLDPGIGFGKTLEHNLDLLRHLERFTALPHRILLGTSRKSFLGNLTGRDVGDRLAGTLATVARARQAGVAAVRVHDVRPTHDLLAVLDAIS